MYPFEKQTSAWKWLGVVGKQACELATTQIHSHPLYSGQWRTEWQKRGERRKKKSRHPVEEQPDYKSLNYNQKGDGPSATASLLFHCSFSRRQLVPLQNTTARWTRGAGSKQGVCMENVRVMSGFHLDFHELWHPRLYAVYTSCSLWICGHGFLKTDVLKE